MKKISFVSAIALAAASLAGIAPAQAEEQKTIVIIDSYFDANLIDGDIVHVCVVDKIMCDRVDQPRNSRQFKDFNHGTVMADIVRQHNSGAKLVLIRAGIHTTSTVNGNTFNAALDWVIANKDVHSIDSVLFSYNVGNGATCRPSTPGVNIHRAHADIVGDIATLKAAGVAVYAASGNYASGNRIDYPACIDDVVAVGSSNWRGSQPRSDVVLSGLRYTSLKLRSDSSSLQDNFPLSFVGQHEVRFTFTTSVTAAIVAATN